MNRRVHVHYSPDSGEVQVWGKCGSYVKEVWKRCS